ncbi:HNH endonuclease, partial [Ralstonia pseudosolanacearum]|uniref:HNH endonuclease n=1 Tax=Ralstonia pseudosolanacearum TaxID=1310165 RepID=UPI003AAF194E
PMSLRRLECFMGYHLGAQHHALIDVELAQACSEADRMSFLPQIFGLMPLEATVRNNPYMEIKPLISQHLRAIGVPPSETLVGILKDICDNFDRTRWREGSARARARKGSIGDLRQHPALYGRVKSRQGRRCAVCGTPFSGGSEEETLDHVIPWRLGGDPPGGWNWQLLCRRCNSAKDTMISAFTTPEYVNWIFDDLLQVKASEAGSFLSEKGRYLALTHYKICQHPGCTYSAKSRRLVVKKSQVTGFAVFDHLTVLCDEHESHVPGAVLG